MAKYHRGKNILKNINVYMTDRLFLSLVGKKKEFLEKLSHR